MSKNVSRRNFLKGAAAGALGLAGVGMLNLNAAKAEGGLTYADMIAWDGQYDVVVVGYGLAGATAAIFAADQGASVLLIDKAPEGHEGGNSRYAGQCIVSGDDYEKLEAYYRAMFAHYSVPEDSFQAYVQNAHGIRDMLKNEMGFEEVYSMKDMGVAMFYNPEYPEFPGSDGVSMYLVSPTPGDGALWKGIRERIKARANKIDVWCGCPGKHLIQEPVSKAVIGVQIEREGQLVNIRANNGVVLSTGGYENNPQMLQDYLNITRWSIGGTTYNTGDGVHMAQEVGADLWHMNTWEGRGQLFGGMSFPVPNGERGIMVNDMEFAKGSVMLVGTSGTRYLPEDEQARHGHIYEHGVWENPDYPAVSWGVFDQKKYDEIMAGTDIIPAQFHDQIIKGETWEELCEKTGMKAEELKDQVRRFNYFVEAGEDFQHGRSIETMAAFDAEGPYYAIEMVIGMLNTQGGPRRNPQAEVLFPDGTPIPHLYSAGELGGTICVQYQGGGNMMECLGYGRIAGLNAAKAKEPLPVLPTEAVESVLTYAIDAEYDRGSSDWKNIGLAANEFLGIGQGIGGDVGVVVTFSETSSGDGKVNFGDIVDIEVIHHNETEGIGDVAFAELKNRIVAAKGTEIDLVSGASITSRAIIEAVNDAKAQYDAAHK